MAQEGDMEQTILTENRQQILDQAREAAALFDLIPNLLEENARLRDQAEGAARELERLRADIDPMRNEIDRRRVEHDEMVEALGRMMKDMDQLMAEIAPGFRLSHRASPFAREAGLNGSQPVLAHRR